MEVVVVVAVRGIGWELSSGSEQRRFHCHSYADEAHFQCSMLGRRPPAPVRRAVAQPTVSGEMRERLPASLRLCFSSRS